MNILTNKIKHRINHQSELYRRIPLYWMLCLSLALFGCQNVAQEKITEPVNFPSNPTKTPLETVSSTKTVAPATPTREITVSSPGDVLATPTPETAITTSSSGAFIADGFILYGANFNGEDQIYALQPGGISRFVTTGRMLPGQAFAPDETKIIIDTNDPSQPSPMPSKVFIFDLVSGETIPLNLLTYPPSGVFWSENGESFLYIANYGDETPDELVQYDIAAGENRILIEREDILDTAGWSVDGQTVAFVARVNDQYDLFTLNSKTLEWEQLTDNSDIETMILWSPTVSQLLVGTILDERSAFEAWPWGIESLYLFDKDSKKWDWLADKFLTSESVSWFPDGKQLLIENTGLLCITDLETMTERCPSEDAAQYNEYFVSFRTRPVSSVNGNWAAYYAINRPCTMIFFLELETNSVVPGDLGCETTPITSSSPIYWSSGDIESLK